MMHDVVVPSAGESVTEGVLAGWSKEDGENVEQGEPLCDLETDKVTMQVTAPAAGKLQIVVAAGATVKVGQVIGRIDAAAEAAAKVDPPIVAPAGMAQARAKLEQGSRPLSPSVRRLVAEQAVDPTAIVPTGPRGHLTKADVLEHLDVERAKAVPVATPAVAARAVAAAPAPVGPATAVVAPPAATAAAPGVASRAREPGGPRETRTKMTVIRQRIAERMVLAQHQAAILTTFNEVDMSRVMALRAEQRESFERRHGVRLGFMSFFIKAVVDALAAVPALNARIDGDEIVQNHYYDIGVAVSTERGLIVPVIRDCDRLGFAEIEKTLADLAARARARTIKLEELTGGSFSISNGGVYGSLLSTPIINPPQSGILGLHAVKKRAVVVGDGVVVRPMMYLAVSYDHRIVDGEQGVTFLKRIVECIESPERMMLES